MRLLLLRLLGVYGPPLVAALLKQQAGDGTGLLLRLLEVPGQPLLAALARQQVGASMHLLLAVLDQLPLAGVLKRPGLQLVVAGELVLQALARMRHSVLLLALAPLRQSWKPEVYPTSGASSSRMLPPSLARTPLMHRSIQRLPLVIQVGLPA